MFSGIVTERGTVGFAGGSDEKWELAVSGSLFSRVQSPPIEIGSSICISGVCLTVVRLKGGEAFFDLASETRRCTSLGKLKPGDFVNLERSLSFGNLVDGHLVQGHVDCVSRLLKRSVEQNTLRFEFELPAKIAALIAPKGSVAIDGVSLTVGEVTSESFSVYIIPHTLEITTFGCYSIGDEVNIEADCVARYVQRAVESYMSHVQSGPHEA